MKKLLFVLFAAALIAACGGDDQDKSKAPQKAQDAAKTEATATATAAPAIKSSAPPVTSDTVAKDVNGSMFVDHSRDVKEFQLRRELFGVEALIESGKQQGLDTKELEAKRDELVNQIKSLLAG